MDILEGRRETKGGKGRQRCGGEEAYTPSRQPLKYNVCIMVTFMCKQTPRIRLELYILRSFEISFVW